MPQWDDPFSDPYSIYACERPCDQAPALIKCKLREPLRRDDYIRLLKLFPPGWPNHMAEKLSREEDTNIQCDIYQVSLLDMTSEDRPYFATLSYAWGDPKPTQQIRCGGTLVPVTQSLHEALVYNRHLRTPRLLWVDCLCIDQSNSEEKSQQVQRMHLVYGQSHCISWLGVEYDRENDLTAMSPILRWLSGILLFFEQSRVQVTWLNVNDHIERNPREGYSSLGDLPWAALQQCLDRDIFSRLWCVQEMLVSRSNDFRTSVSHVDISVLARSCRLLSYILRDSLKSFEDVKTLETMHLLPVCCYNVQRTLSGKSSQGGTLPCIKYTRPATAPTASAAATAMALYYKECSDPRDRVYGLAGLCNLDASYQINYSKTTLTVQQVFVDFTLHCLGKTMSLELFRTKYRITALRASNTGIPFLQHRNWLRGLPSWCPDFAGPRDYVRDLLHANQRLKASRGRPARFTILTRQCVAAVGVYIGSVKKCSAQWRGPNPDEDFHTHWENVYGSFQRCTSSINTTSPGCSLWKLYLDVFSAGAEFRQCSAWSYVWGFLPARTRDRMVKSTIGAAWIMSYMPTLAPNGGLTLNRRLDADSWNHVAYVVNDWLHDRSRGTRLFTTDNPAAVLGTGLDGTRVGDIVCVLFGSDVPFILRQVGDQGNYKLIGECYVAGIMRGEALDMGLEEREFRLI